MHRGSPEDPFRQLARVIGEHSPRLIPERTLAESTVPGRASVEEFTNERALVTKLWKRLFIQAEDSKT